MVNPLILEAGVEIQIFEEIGPNAKYVEYVGIRLLFHI